MTWFAVYETGNGRLESVGTVLPDMLRTGLASVALVGEPLQSEMWDEATLAFVARPVKVLIDRLDDLRTGLDYSDFQRAYNALSVSGQSDLDAGLIRILGDARFRNSSEQIVLDSRD